MPNSRPPTGGRRSDSQSGQSVASSVDTGAWAEYKAYPDPIHKACEQCDLEVRDLNVEGAFIDFQPLIFSRPSVDCRRVHVQKSWR
mgnify:CR=1 FL=1